jgi:hypothetical protein
MDQPWYQDFVSDEKMDRDMLFDMLTAANFMGIKPLLDLTCLKVTFQLTGKNAEEVRLARRFTCALLLSFRALIILIILLSLDSRNFETPRIVSRGRSSSAGRTQVDFRRVLIKLIPAK